MTLATLIAALRHDHAQMRELFDTARCKGMASATGQQQLRQARRMIAEHLQLEDAQLYPALRACAGTHPLANEYADEMQALPRDILAFIGSMEHQRDNPTFARDFGKLLGTPSECWTREEVRLYPACDTYCAGREKPADRGRAGSPMRGPAPSHAGPAPAALQA